MTSRDKLELIRFIANYNKDKKAISLNYEEVKTLCDCIDYYVNDFGKRYELELPTAHKLREELGKMIGGYEANNQ